MIALLSLVSLGAIFIVLYSRYRSVVLSLIIMANIPLALIGSVIALWLAGQPLSVATMIGFITLAGISARNGILKISHYINLVLHEGETFGPKYDHAGQPRTANASADDRTVRRFRAIAADDWGGRTGQGDTSSGRYRHFWRPDHLDLLDTLLTPVLFLRYGAKPLERLRRRARRAQNERSLLMSTSATKENSMLRTLALILSLAFTSARLSPTVTANGPKDPRADISSMRAAASSTGSWSPRAMNWSSMCWMPTKNRSTSMKEAPKARS